MGLDQAQGWIDFLKAAPLPTIVLALSAVCVHLYRSKTALQAQYTADMVDATKALQALTAVNLERAHAAQFEWVGAIRDLKDEIRQGRSK